MDVKTTVLIMSIYWVSNYIGRVRGVGGVRRLVSSGVRAEGGVVRKLSGVDGGSEPLSPS